jgi:hypothetical protein
MAELDHRRFASLQRLNTASRLRSLDPLRNRAFCHARSDGNILLFPAIGFESIARRLRHSFWSGATRAELSILFMETLYPNFTKS